MIAFALQSSFRRLRHSTFTRPSHGRSMLDAGTHVRKIRLLDPRQQHSPGQMKFMSERSNARRSLLVAFVTAIWGPTSLADPLHKVDHEGAYQHEQSGWLFPKQLGEFTRLGPPYTIDGNNDVGAEYQLTAEGVRMTAVVEVYSADSAAEHADLLNSKTAFARKLALRAESEDAFIVQHEPEIVGVKVIYAPGAEAKPMSANLYFLRTEHWIVNIRGTVEAAASDAPKVSDEFVRHLPWQTLGVDPGDLHSARR
jgi:hypothetical protein